MAGLEGDPDFAVGFEPADAWSVARARIDDDERTARLIDRGALRRNDANERVVHGPGEGAAVKHKLHLVVEHMRSDFREMFTIGVTPFAHHVPKQDAPLRGVDTVFGCGGERAERKHKSGIARLGLVRRHAATPLLL